ncbi:flagellar basal body-associated FliL family protein [Chthonobacter rhizosphaerae]|uniref:flagellar basal body-associated FliL family protein n=1 Tax=Chthonobacter rhizosphaerae TaxID=2735553 RepID=UPI0015EE4EC4|nr:flagellar basal body-associated FliL family protein [Chthonobacter rhizosphaerae]
MAAAASQSDMTGKRISLLKSVIFVVLLSLTAAAIGVGSSVYLVELAKVRLAEEQEKEREAAKTASEMERGSRMVRLQSMVTNLRRPESVWIRLDVSILLNAEAGTSTEVTQAEIETDFLAYLKTLELSQIEGSIGLQALREDLQERAILRADGVAREVVINGMVVQ